MKDHTGRVIAQLPVDTATFLLNEKRGPIAELESRYLVTVTIVPNETLLTPNYEILRVRLDHMQHQRNPRLHIEHTRPKHATLAHVAWHRSQRSQGIHGIVMAK